MASLKILSLLVATVLLMETTQGRSVRRPKICQRVCPEIYNPVCGSNEVTYSNTCKFNKAKRCESKNRFIKIVKRKACDDESTCSKPCSKIPRPVCGNDGKTYPNRCRLVEARECKNPDLKFVHRGRCRDCKSPKEIGSCKASIKRWFFNTSEKKCEPFYYGGCGGNNNNYRFEKACKKACEK